MAAANRKPQLTSDKAAVLRAAGKGDLFAKSQVLSDCGGSILLHPVHGS